MIGSDRSVEACLIKGTNDLIHVEVSVTGNVACLLEVVVLTGSIVESQVSYVSEMNTALKYADHVRKIILKVCAVGT